MKTIWYVYELYNELGSVEYVGESRNLKARMEQHKCKNGKFYGRTDIHINIVKEFNSKTDAFKFQCQLQKEYNMETDGEKYSKSQIGNNKGIKNAGKIRTDEMKNHQSKIKLGKKMTKESSDKKRDAMKLWWAKRKSTNVV
jgi:predicted GIY-YIG superfamily endonuclease